MLQNEFLVKIKTMDQAKRFADTVERMDVDVDLRQGRYNVSGSSLMGIFSLDLTRPMMARIMSHDGKVIVDAYHKLEEFEDEDSRAECRDFIPYGWKFYSEVN